MHPVDERFGLRGADPGNRCVRSHATGVRALVSVECPLEVLSGYQRDSLSPVAQREQRDLRPVEKLLHDHVVPGVAEGAERLFDLALGAANVDALAGREAVGLHDARRPREREAPSGGYSRCRHDVFANALEPSIRAAAPPGPKTSEAEAAQRVGQAENERHLRPDHDEIDVQ